MHMYMYVWMYVYMYVYMGEYMPQKCLFNFAKQENSQMFREKSSLLYTSHFNVAYVHTARTSVQTYSMYVCPSILTYVRTYIHAH